MSATLVAAPSMKNLEIKFNFINEEFISKYAPKHEHEVSCIGGNILILKTKHSSSGSLKQLEIKHKNEIIVQSIENLVPVLETVISQSGQPVIFKFKYAFDVTNQKLRGLKQLELDYPGAAKGNTYTESIPLASGNIADFIFKY